MIKESFISNNPSTYVDIPSKMHTTKCKKQAFIQDTTGKRITSMLMEERTCFHESLIYFRIVTTFLQINTVTIATIISAKREATVAPYAL